MALAPLSSAPVLTGAVSDSGVLVPTTTVSDVDVGFSRLSFTSDASDDSQKYHPKKDWREISRMVSQVSGDLSKLHSKDLEIISEIATAVESLELQCALEMPHEFFALFRNVKYLYIQKVDDTVLVALTKLTSLRTLILRSCEKVTNRGMLHLRVHLSLKTVRMYALSNTCSGFSYLSALTNLRKLTFSTGALLTEKELLPLFSCLPKLEFVEIEKCQFNVVVGGEFLRALMAMRSLRVIKIRKISWQLDPEYFVGNVLQYHPTLQKINKVSYQRHTDETFLRWLDTLDPNCEEFVATGCFGLQAASLELLLQKFRKLKTVELHNCSQFNYIGLISLTKQLTGQKIELFGCQLCESSEIEYESGSIKINQPNATPKGFLTAIKKEKSMPIKSEKDEKKKPEMMYLDEF